jgi:hypothetical protein
VNHLHALLALRKVLLSTVVSTTGATTLSATGNGFVRTTGSFVEDGFVVGMEVVPSGFTSNTPGVIRHVTATDITLEGVRQVEAAGSNRRLTVGVPLLRGWENQELTPLAGQWYIEEDYIPGPVNGVSLGQKEHLPMYVLRLSGLAGKGVSALYRVADAILASFPPKLAMPMEDGFPLRVSSDTAPYRGQVLSSGPGRADVAITIPLWKRTPSPNPN